MKTAAAITTLLAGSAAAFVPSSMKSQSSALKVCYEINKLDIFSDTKEIININNLVERKKSENKSICCILHISLTYENENMRYL